MRLLRSPLMALVAMLILIGPIAGRVTQIDPTDPYQISTPSPWERSKKIALPEAEPVFQFSHAGITEDSKLRRRYSVGDDLLLASPNELAYIHLSTMTAQWSFQSDFEILHLSFVSPEPEDRRIVVSGESACVMLDLSSGNSIWSSPECPPGDFYIWESGILVHLFGSEEERSLRSMDVQTGDVFWSYNYPVDSQTISPIIESIDQRAIYVSTAQSIDALSIDTGEVLWTTPIQIERGIFTPGSHLLALGEEEIISLDPASGAEIWFNFMEPGYVVLDQWVQPNTGDKLIVRLDSSVMLLDLESGLELAHFEDATLSHVYLNITEEPHFLHSGTLLLTMDDSLVAVDWVTLEQAWQVADTGEVDRHYLSTREVLLFTAENGLIILVGTSSGELLGTYEPTDFFFAPGGEIIVLQDLQELEAFDIGSSETLWSYRANNEIKLSNATADHVLFSDQQKIYVLDARTGILVNATDHPNEWQRYMLNNRFAVYWDGFSLTIRHHLTNTSHTFNGIYSWDDFSLSDSGTMAALAYGATVVLLDRETGEVLFTGDTPLDSRLEDGEYLMVYAGGEEQVYSLILIGKDGTILWEHEFSLDYMRMMYFNDVGKVLLQGRTNSLLLNSETGELIMDVPIAYDPDGSNDGLYFSPADALLVSSDYSSAIYQVPGPAMSQLAHETIVRGAPSASGVERATFPAGTQIVLTGNTQERSDGIWHEVVIEDVTGWINERDFLDAPATPQATPSD